MNKKKPQRSDSCWKLLAICFGLVAAVLIAEAAIRFLEPLADTRGIQLKNSQRLFGFKENSKGFAGGVEFEINSSGFRTDDFDKNVGKEETVVIVLGDSYAFGYGVRYQYSFPFVLQLDLKKEYPHKNVRVVNLGIPGYNTTQELATLKEVGLRLRPKLVLLAYNLNDIEGYFESTNKELISFRKVLTVIKDKFHLLRFVLPRIAALARSLHIKVETTATAEVQEYVTEGVAWRRNQTTLKELFELCRRNDCRMGVIVLPYVVQLTDNHPCIHAYEQVIAFCRSQKVPAVNAFEYFRGMDARKLWINAFDGHPNSQGHVLIAKAAADLIRKNDLFGEGVASE